MKYLLFYPAIVLLNFYTKIGLETYSNLFVLLFVPTFNTKVTEYLCSGCVFFLQTNFDFLTSHFDGIFFISFKKFCCLELKFEKIFHL